MRNRDPEYDYDIIRKALLLRRPDDPEYGTAAHLALAALSRIERRDMVVASTRTARAYKRVVELLAQ